MANGLSGPRGRGDGGGSGGGGDPGDRRVAGLPPTVFYTGLVSFFMDVSSEMVYPLVPLFLSSVLGVNKALIGLIEGLAEATASLLKVFSGWLSDRYGRRKLLLVLGYGISALSRPGLALSASWGQVLAMRSLDRFGKGVRTAPRDAIIADCSDRREFGRSYGFHRAMDQFGAVVGPAIAFAVLTFVPDSYRLVFWISLIPACIAVAVIVFFVRDPGRPKRMKGEVEAEGEAEAESPDSHSAAVSLGARMDRLRRLRGPLLNYLIVSGIFAVGNSSDVFLILRAGDLGIALGLIPVAYLLYNLVYSGLSIPAGLLADRIGRRRLLAAGYAVFVLTYAGMALAEGALSAWLLFLVYGLYMAISDGTARALVAELAPAERRATAFGAYHAVVGLGALPASLIAGTLWDAVSPAAPFWLGAATAALAAVLLTVLVPNTRKCNA